MKYNNIIYGPFFPKVRISLVYSLIRLFKTEQYIFSFFSSICTVCFFLVGKSFEVIIVESRPVFVRLIILGSLSNYYYDDDHNFTKR